MKNLKKAAALSMAAALAVSMTACGGSTSSADTSTTTDTPASSTDSGAATGGKITVWTLSNDLKQFAEEYTKATGTEVDVVVYDSADYVSKVTPSLGAKSTDVDVFVGEPQMLPNFYEAGFCADLSELKDEASEKLVPYVVQAGTDEDGVLRALYGFLGQLYLCGGGLLVLRKGGGGHKGCQHACRQNSAYAAAGPLG